MTLLFTEAIEAAVAARVGLGMGVWRETGPLRARMGLHAGTASSGAMVSM